jgi:hypothetical protein
MVTCVNLSRSGQRRPIYHFLKQHDTDVWSPFILDRHLESLSGKSLLDALLRHQLPYNKASLIGQFYPS